MRLWSWLLLLFAAVSASCEVAGRHPSSGEALREAVREADREARGLGGTGNFGAVVGFDDVTNGLVHEAAGVERGFDASQWARVVEGDAGPNAGTASVVSHDDGLSDRVAEPRQERMLIYRGNLAVEVPRAEDAAKAFLAQVEAWGGYLQSQTGTRLSVRLPAERFDEAFTAAKGTGRVLHEQRSASDVTEEFVDLGIRLDNARKSRERLIELLQKADKVEDMLKIENELRRLTEEIERMEGRVKFLRDQVAMATLDIEFRSVAEAPPPPPHRRQPSRFAWINLVGASNLMERF